MDNEELVENIRNGYSVTACLEELYMNNLPLIKKVVRPYAAFVPLEDLEQESYFALTEAVSRYESSANVKFSTYLVFWIKQAARRYVDDNVSCIRLPSYLRQELSRYNKTVQRFQQDHGRVPAIAEIAALLKVPRAKILTYQFYSRAPLSLDTPIDEESDCLMDTLEAEISVENNVIDEIYRNYEKSALWGIVERFATLEQKEILEMYFIEGKTIAEIARKNKKSFHSVRNELNKTLRKLRTGKPRRELEERLEIVSCKVYAGGLQGYITSGSSITEYIALERLSMEGY